MANLPARDHKPLVVHEYGCVQCQRWHVRELDPELYDAHLMFQSKHGWRERYATVGETFAIELKK